MLFTWFYLGPQMAHGLPAQKTHVEHLYHRCRAYILRMLSIYTTDVEHLYFACWASIPPMLSIYTSHVEHLYFACWVTPPAIATNTTSHVEHLYLACWANILPVRSDTFNLMPFSFPLSAFSLPLSAFSFQLSPFLFLRHWSKKNTIGRSSTKIPWTNARKRANAFWVAELITNIVLQIITKITTNVRHHFV